MCRKLPPWLTIKSGNARAISETKRCVSQFGLQTICEQAKCPNLLHCFERKQATFLLLGSFCTRACGFCAVEHHKSPPKPDPNEPEAVANACLSLGLKHVVLTMVTRDDLEDGGAEQVALTIRAVKRKLPEASCEALVSDFQGNEDAIRCILEAEPDVVAHNVETVPRLTPRIRSRATFERSLEVLSKFKEIKKDQTTKSGFMVGLGENFNEVIDTLALLAKVPVDTVTIGQYLQPTPRHLAVKNFVPPETFQKYQEEGTGMGILRVVSGPFVRSSFVS